MNDDLNAAGPTAVTMFDAASTTTIEATAQQDLENSHKGYDTVLHPIAQIAAESEPTTAER